MPALPLACLGSFPLPPEEGEVAPRSGDGVGEGVRQTRSRRKTGTMWRASNLRRARRSTPTPSSFARHLSPDRRGRGKGRAMSGGD
ncbi:hypothetical protein CIT25_12450 [Mesorhizobium mediterraneum]|uniref:Uncharacterized protein n=1 Tax=Mesorhizobium mediterraneum TaxID=43617 RepID=A0AB36RBE6_9HYPH|nr:hypothetical protein CIT25_12450 [Mesorhizobium mediterraneum]